MLGKQVVNQALGQMDPRAQTVLPSTWYVLFSLSLSDSQTTTIHSLSKGDPYSLLHTAPSGRWVTEREQVALDLTPFHARKLLYLQMDTHCLM